MAALRVAFGSAAMTNPIEDFRQSKVILVIGSNTTEQHPLAAERILDAQKNHGATLIVIDPRETALAKLADIYLPILPGSDVALLNYLCKVIIDESLYDKDFIDERTEGFTELCEHLAKQDFSTIDAITGIGKDTLDEVARRYATGETSSIAYCMGITQQATGTNNCLALCNLVMLCGMAGRPGTGLNPLRGQNNVQGSCDMGALPDVMTDYLPAGTPLAYERFSPLWGDFCNEVGMKLTEMFDAIDAGTIKGLYVVGENPAVSDPNNAHAIKSMAELDFMVVQDIFMTETAELAHLVLPATSWLEKDGTFTNTERRVQRISTVTHLEGTLPDWLIITKLLQAMGEQANYDSPEAIFNEMRLVTPNYKGMTYQRLLDEDGLQWPCPHEEHPGTPILHVGGFTRGKGHFSPTSIELLHEKTSPEYPYILTTGRVGFHYHTGTMTRRAWMLDREYPENFIQMHPHDAKTLGLWENQSVIVESKRGTVEAMVRISSHIREGVFFMPFHFSENAANTLTNTLTDPIAGIPSFKYSAVRIKKE